MTLETEGGAKGKKTSPAGLGGTLTLQNRTSSFSIPLDQEPERFWLDQRGEVLARFRDASAYPKESLARLALRQDDAEALETLSRALRSPLYSLEVRELFGISNRAALNELEKLMELGVVQKTGQGRSVRYVLI